MANLFSVIQQANINVDNQQVKDNLQREQVISGLVHDVKKKEEANKQAQETGSTTGQATSSTSKG